MNVIQQNQLNRQTHVAMIAASIKKSLDNGKTIDFKQLILSTKVNLNLSQKTTQDYIERALYSIGVKEENLKDEGFVKIWSSTKDE